MAEEEEKEVPQDDEEEEEDIDEEKLAAIQAEQEEEAARIVLALTINNYLATLTDDVLYTTVTSLEHDVIYLPIENEILENFLIVNEPTLLTGMDTILETAAQLKKGHLYVAVESQTSIFGSLSAIDRYERINLSQRTDLVLREVEELDKNLAKFIAKMKRKRYILKAELEELEIRHSEVNDWMKSFENIVVIEGLEELTGRIPAEKFVKYMHDWLKNQQFHVEKMRLRLATTKDKHNKTRIVFAQKEEIGETLRVVDFEKILIENQNYIEQVEQKNVHLVELKKMTGRSNLVLSTHKKYLLLEVEQQKKLQKDIEDIKIQNKELLQENEIVIGQVVKERINYERIKQYVDDYTVPDVLEYVKMKHNLYDVRREVKALTRKKNLLLVSLRSKLKEIKKLTGIKETQSEWLLPIKERSLDSLDSCFSIGTDTSDECLAMSYVKLDFADVLGPIQVKKGQVEK